MPGIPKNIPLWIKWALVAIVSICTLAVSFVSSAYVGGMDQIVEAFDVDELIATLGVDLYVLGFAIGAILWAPFSEIYGRQAVLFATYGAMTLFNAGAIFSPNIQTTLDTSRSSTVPLLR
jgi:predicted MFS family arabinose efflux permease